LEGFFLFLLSSWTSVCPHGGCFSPGFLGFLILPLFFLASLDPLFYLMVASPFSFSDVSIKGNAFFLRFSFVKEIVSVPSLDVFCLILFKRVQVFCWMEDLHSLKRGV